jgi:hypothetical protein
VLLKVEVDVVVVVLLEEIGIPRILEREIMELTVD